MDNNADQEKCAKCGEPETVARIDADGLCRICSALERLHDAIQTRQNSGTLFDRQRSGNDSVLPPSDRNEQ